MRMVRIWREMVVEGVKSERIEGIRNNRKNLVEWKRVFWCVEVVGFVGR